MASEPIIGSSVDNDGGGTSVDSNNVNCGAFCLLTSDRTSLGNDASRKLALQKVLKSTGSDVLEVQTLRNTNKTLAKLDYPSNDPGRLNKTLQIKKVKANLQCLVLEAVTVQFTGEYSHTLMDIAQQLVNEDPELEDLGVLVDKAKGTIQGSWNLIEKLRNKILTVLVSLLENDKDMNEESIISEVKRLVSDSGTDIDTSQQNESTETTTDRSIIQDNGGRQGNQSPPSESIPGLDPLIVQWILRTKGVDSSVLQCSEDYTTVTVSGDQDVFIDTYQKCVMGNRVKREAITFNVTQNQEKHVMLLSECEEKFKQVLFVHDMPQRTLHIVSEDLDQFQTAKKHIQNSLHTFTPSPSQRPHQGTQRTGASVVVIPLSDGVKLTVKKGDLLKEQVIAIVNAANECLDHGGGVAWAIDRASGGVVQKLSNDLKKRRGGNVPTGQVALTGGGGKLICKKVIHAVGPDARDHPPDICDKLLHEVCVNILKTSEANNFTSIAIPPISSGIFAMPKQRVAKILIDTILNYPYRQPFCLKDIRIVIIDDETLRPFTAYATEVKERLQQHSQSPQPTAQQKVPAQQSGQASPSLLSDDIIDVPIKGSHRKIILKKAHFIYEDVDIKVVGISSELGFEKGTLKNLNDQMGGQLLKAIQGRYQYNKPERFDVFTVHCQPSSISCRYLVVVNFLDQSLGTRHDSHKLLQQVLHAVCKEADTLEMPSVAIAPNTFAVGGFKREDILTQFLHIFIQYQFTNDEFLTDVRFMALGEAEFSNLIASAERFVGKTLRKAKENHTNQHTTNRQGVRPNSSPPETKMDFDSGKHHSDAILPSPPVQGAGGGSTNSNNHQPDGPPCKQPPHTKPHPVSVPASLTISTATVDLSANVSATVFTGDTHVADTDIIICPLPPGFELNGLSQTLNEISKGLIARNLKDHKEPQPSEGDIVVLNPGKTRELKAQHIIFFIRTKKSSAQVTQEGCLKALKYAEENGCNSLAVPAVLSSKAKEHMTRALLAALKQFTPQHKMEIVLVVPPNDETTLGILRKTLPFENVTHPVEEECDQEQFGTPSSTPPPLENDH